MTEKEVFLKMIRKATKNSYERSAFKDCWPDYSEFEKNYFEEEGNAITVTNNNEDETFFYFDDDGSLISIE